MSKNCEVIKAGLTSYEVKPTCPKCGHKEPKERIETGVGLLFSPEPVYQMQCSKCGYFYQYKAL